MSEKYYSAKYDKSFAAFTVRNRFPKIFHENCSGDWDEIIKKTSIKEAFANAGSDVVKYKDISEQCVKRAQKIDGTLSEESSLKDFFEHAPFFEAEVLFYHFLLCQKNYHKNKFDFFASKKDADYAGKHEIYRTELSRLFSEEVDYTKIKNARKRILIQNKNGLWMKSLKSQILDIKIKI